MRVEIRRILPDEGDALMRTRLLSLLDAPYAFAATYMDEAQRPTTAWSERAREASEGIGQAVLGDEPVELRRAYHLSGRSPTRSKDSPITTPSSRSSPSSR